MPFCPERLVARKRQGAQGASSARRAGTVRHNASGPTLSVSMMGVAPLSRRTFSARWRSRRRTLKS